MLEQAEWEAKAQGIVCGAMVQRGITYVQLSERLAGLGVLDDERNLRNKVSRGKFTATFFLQCLAALGVSATYHRRL